MAAALTALGRRGVWPAPHVCARCGSTRDACRGFPGDVWYCAAHVPPELRCVGEPGYRAPEAAPRAPAPLVRAPEAAAPDLLTGLSSA